jgi:adenylate cyclase
VQAVSCAKAIQEANGTGLALRIGIHLGDVVVQGDDLMGDGVNIAARIEGVADPGGIALSRAVHEQVRDKLDVAFVDRGEVELKNIPRPVQVFLVGSSRAPELPSTLPLPDKPSIAVLPFQNMSGDPEQEYFADGIVEDIITALSRFKSLFVIARNSSFAYKGKSPDIRHVGRELGVRYVLEGSVRKAGGRIRITGQLINAATGTHIWADRFDGALDDVFDLQDRVTGSIVGAIAPRVEQTEIASARHRPAGNVDAYDCLLRAMARLYELTGPATDDALSLINAALQRDPKSAMAHALKGFCYSWRHFNGWMRDVEEECADTERHALRALELAGDDAAVIAYCGYTLAAVNGQLSVGAELIDRALELNPNLALGWADALGSALPGRSGGGDQGCAARSAAEPHRCQHTVHPELHRPSPF